MFFDDLNKIPEIAKKTGFSIFAVPNPKDIKITHEIRITPGKNSQIKKEQTDELINICKNKESESRFITVEYAEKMNISAENSILKLLEEPKDNYHIVFLVKEPSGLLKTILSRAKIYIFRQKDSLSTQVVEEQDIKMYAKKLITAKTTTLCAIMKEIASEKEYKKPNNSRFYALRIVETAIEMLYKSYFQTRNPELLKKLPNFLALYDNLKQNGNIKLHLVADLC